jgi:hypothetical protein
VTFGDPLVVLMRREGRSCKACVHVEALQIAGTVRDVCAFGKKHGKRCRRYEEKKAMTLEERLDNWGRVVRSPKYQTGVCAAWAKWYVAKRGEDAAVEPHAAISPDDRDGWMIERAWCAMPAHAPKWLLKYHYVWRMSPEQIRVRMFKNHSTRIHQSQIDAYIADARSRLTRELVRLTADTIIRTASQTSCKPEKSTL